MKINEASSIMVLTLFVMLVSVGTIKHTALYYHEKREKEGVKEKVDPAFDRATQKQKTLKKLKQVEG